MSNPITTASNPRVGPLERVRHLKRGTEYEVLGEAELQVSVARDEPVELLETTLDPEFVCCEGDRLVIYKGADGKLWAREVSEFRDGRFETIASAPSPEAGAGGDLGAEAKRVMDAAWPEYGGNNQSAEFWQAFNEAVGFTLKLIRSGKLVASTGSGEETKGERTITLPALKADQIAHLRDLQASLQAETQYDTETRIGPAGPAAGFDGYGSQARPLEPQSSPSQTPVNPQMTVEEARQGVRGTEVQAFAKAVLHGDDEHRDWLTEAADAWVCGRPLPAPRGKGTTPEAALRTLQAAGEVRHG